MGPISCREREVSSRFAIVNSKCRRVRSRARSLGRWSHVNRHSGAFSAVPSGSNNAHLPCLQRRNSPPCAGGWRYQPPALIQAMPERLPRFTSQAASQPFGRSSGSLGWVNLREAAWGALPPGGPEACPGSQPPRVGRGSRGYIWPTTSIKPPLL